MSGLRQRVFISYSRQPEENSAFVRGLARTLRANGFEPWLDEEQIPGAADFEVEIRKAIETARHGLFVITRRWLERPYTRMELNLFSRHDPASHYRVGVNREGLDPLSVAAQLQQLHIIDWRPDDLEPDARVWEVYAALTRKAPGARDDWAEKGRKLIINVRAEVPAAEAARPAPEPAGADWMLETAPPVAAVPTRDATLLLTDGPDCFRADADGAVRPLPPLQPWAAVAVTADGVPVVGQYNQMLALLRGDDWEHRALDAPVLALAAGAQGMAVGDAAGGVTLLPCGDDRPQTVRFGRPIAALCPVYNGAVVLSTACELARVSWGDGDRVEPIATADPLDRLVGLFDLSASGRVGVFSADAVGVLDASSSRVLVGRPAFGSPVRAVVPLGRYPDQLAVLTDAGRLFFLDSGLTVARPVLLPSDTAEVAGVCRAGASGVVAWTVGGAAFHVGRDRTVRRLAAANVVVAWAHPANAKLAQVVLWVEGQGLRVASVRID